MVDFVIRFLHQSVEEVLQITLVFPIIIGDQLIDHKVKIKFSLGKIYSRKYCYFFLNEII